MDLELEINLNEYLSIYQIAEELNRNSNNKLFIRSLEKSIMNLPNEFKITKVKLKEEYSDKQNRAINELYLKKDLDRFYSNFVSKVSLYSKLKKNVSNVSISKYYKEFNTTEITFGGKTDIFISKEAAQEITELMINMKKKDRSEWRSFTFEQYKIQYNYMSLDEVMKKINCSYETTGKLIKSKLLKVKDRYGGKKLFEKKHVQELILEQAKLIEKYNSDFYTSKQIQAKFNDAFTKYIKGSEDKVRIKVTKVDPPLLLVSYFGLKVKLYDKKEIDTLWEDYKIYTEMNSISLENPFEDFLNKVDNVLNIKFSKAQQNTKKLWFQYVEKFLIKTRISGKNRLIFMTNQFARCTETIFYIFNREIYSYSAQEINDKFLNDVLNIRRSYQRDFYNFLKQMLQTFTIEGLPLPYGVDELNDPRTFKRIKEVATDIYSLEEYHALYKYTLRIELHKEKAIQDVLELTKSNNITKYRHYDSCWLYILVQLTNNWRHSTVLSQIPRIDLSTTSIKNLEWLKHNDPSTEDANIIIYQIGRYVTKINKTDVSAEGIFNIGDPLKIAFATAISICEFRRRATCDNSSTLIELSGHLVKETNPHRIFFSEFTNGFKFENRKMNRTLSTLIWSVLRHMGQGLKESQVSRSHLQDQTTISHYIKLSNEQVKKLVEEIFERNQFGFVTQSLTNIIFGAENNKSIETKRMLEINQHFGDVFKIEVTAGLLNRIATEREQVLEYLEKFDLEGLRDLFYQSLTGLLPSKQRYYQCIYAECKYENEYGERPSCDTCVASMVNVYALENIMDNYIFMMEKISKTFECAPIGEKQKLANQFFLLHNVVNQARIRFGREVVDGFVEGKTERIKKLGLDLSTKGLKDYRTIGVLKGG